MIEGLLSELHDDYKDSISENISKEILIVAGGGGGCFYYNNGNNFVSFGNGGSGGGYIGGNSNNLYRKENGVIREDQLYYGYGGTQTESISSKNSLYNGGFGYGSGYILAAGGGGFYGGTAGEFGGGRRFRLHR